MIGSTRAIKVWAYPRPVDLRKGYDGLYGLVANGLGENPLSGDYFLFVNRVRNRAKVLLWDGTGLCIYMKRIERGLFAALWASGPKQRLELTTSELALYLEGCIEIGRKRLSPAQFVPSALASGDQA